MEGIGKLIINESPLTVLPTLAKLVGLQQAIIIQQIHYLCQQPKSGKVLQDGKKYIWNSYEEWIENYFPFWSKPTVIKHFTELEESGLIIAQQPNKHKFDHTKYYRVCYSKLLSLLESTDSKETILSDGKETIPSDSKEPLPSLNEQRLLTKTTYKDSTTTRGKTTEIPVNEEYASKIESLLEWMLIESKELRLPYEREYPQVIEELLAEFADSEAEVKKYFSSLVANKKINCLSPNMLRNNLRRYKASLKSETTNNSYWTIEQLQEREKEIIEGYANGK